MRHILLSLALAASLSAPLVAQSSEFGIRGLGIPGRPFSARTLGSGGSFGLFDGQSSYNPAALSSLPGVTSVFTNTTTWRTSVNPSGSLGTRDARFPQLLVGGPVPHTHFALGASYSLYADRDFTVASDGSESPRGVPVAVHDTLTSRGGINDIRLAAAWVPAPTFALGVAAHLLTGVNRLASRRFWEDTSYLAPRQTAELSYSAQGVSIGALWRPLNHLEVGGMLRHDGTLSVHRDSTFAGKVGLPTTLSFGVRVTPRAGFSIGAQYAQQSWSKADSGIVAQGSVGARNTTSFSAGIDLVRNRKRPNSLPVRLGFRAETLPFLLISADQPKATSFTLGTGFRFGGDRAGFDIALERVKRSQGSLYTENSTILTIGLSIRSSGPN